MSSPYDCLKEYARALADYIASEPLKTRALRSEILRIDFLLRRLKAKKKILWETQKYQSKLNKEVPIELKEKSLSYNPYKR